MGYLPPDEQKRDDMDFWEFLARSEWPLVVGGALLVFREAIRRKLDSTVKASGLGVSLEFSEAIAKAEALVADSSTSIPLGDKATPEMIILEAWRHLAHQISRAQGGQSATTWLWNPSRFRGAAGLLGLTDDEVAALIELREIRNRVAHTVGAPISPTEAERFKQVTQRLIQKLTRIKAHAPPVATNPSHPPEEGVRGNTPAPPEVTR